MTCGLMTDKDFVVCAICNRRFRQITSTHLAKDHGISFEEYKVKFPNVETLPVAVRETISQKAKEMNANGIIGFKDGHAVNAGKSPWNKGTHGLQPPVWSKGQTKETNATLAAMAGKISKTRKLQYKSGKLKPRCGAENPMYGKKLSEDHKRALLGGWKPCKTKPELAVADIIKDYSDWKFVGDGKFFVKTKEKTRVPDFVNPKLKRIIEVYGDYWHKGENPQDRIDEYKSAGWDCIVLWEHEVLSDDFSVEVIKKFLTR